MDALWIILLFLLAMVGWAILFLGLPGTLLIWASAAMYAVARDFSSGDQRVLSVLLIYVLAAEGLEFAVFYWQSKKAKLENDVIIAGIVGGVVGAFVGFPIPILGSLIGVFLGVWMGTWVYVLWKTRQWQRAWALSCSALISRALSIVAKVMVGALMMVYLLLQFV